MADYKRDRLLRRSRRTIALAVVFLLLFLALIAALKTVDVRSIGPNGSSVGLSALNSAVRQRMGLQDGGYDIKWYNITDMLGKLCILTVPGFALLGLCQLFRRKSLKRVDPDLFALAGLYIVLGIAYVLFEKVIVNYRPVILETALEASFPSSHTMLAICLVSSALVQAGRRVRSSALLFLLDVLGVLIMLVMTVGRLASGVHWFTDVLGGVLLGAALSSLYAGIVARLNAGQD